MTAATLTRLPEVSVADIAQLGVPNSLRIAAKSVEDFVRALDEVMISTVILQVKALTLPVPVVTVIPNLAGTLTAPLTDHT